MICAAYTSSEAFVQQQSRQNSIRFIILLNQTVVSVILFHQILVSFRSHYLRLIWHGFFGFAFMKPKLHQRRAFKRNGWQRSQIIENGRKVRIQSSGTRVKGIKL